MIDNVIQNTFNEEIKKVYETKEENEEKKCEWARRVKIRAEIARNSCE